MEPWNPFEKIRSSIVVFKIRVFSVLSRDIFGYGSFILL